MEAKQQNIVVQVSTLTGKPVHVTVSETGTVARLKRHIFKAIALPVAQQRLMFRSTQLKGALLCPCTDLHRLDSVLSCFTLVTREHARLRARRRGWP